MSLSLKLPEGKEEGVLGDRGGQLKVSEPPCGPPNLHLMPIIRFLSQVF